MKWRNEVNLSTHCHSVECRTIKHAKWIEREKRPSQHATPKKTAMKWWLNNKFTSDYNRIMPVQIFIVHRIWMAWQNVNVPTNFKGMCKGFAIRKKKKQRPPKWNGCEYVASSKYMCKSTCFVFIFMQPIENLPSIHGTCGWVGVHVFLNG